MISDCPDMILIADAHLNGGETEDTFFRMLARLDTLPDSVAVIFLGDIFDLWFALPGYESAAQRKFLDWCAQARKNRIVCFLEGNHEFFVSRTRRNYFTDCSARSIRLGNVLLFHGDLVNRADWKYRLLRIAVRNPFTCAAMILGRAAGPSIAWRIRHGLKGTNKIHKKAFPRLDAARLLAREGTRGIKCVFAGHFHERRHLEESGETMEILPSYAECGEIGRYKPSEGRLEIGKYDAILSEFTEKGVFSQK